MTSYTDQTGTKMPRDRDTFVVQERSMSTGSIILGVLVVLAVIFLGYLALSAAWRSGDVTNVTAPTTTEMTPAPTTIAPPADNTTAPAPTNNDVAPPADTTQPAPPLPPAANAPAQ